jgi:hypothetical protein
MKGPSLSDQFSNAPLMAPGAGRDVIWRLLDGLGLEHCRLVWSERGPILSGIVVTSDEGEPATIEYSVHCDHFWHTREATVDVNRASERAPKALRLESDGDGRWWRLEDDIRIALPELDGCLDIDIAVTPATNTLPIRRLDMAPGGRADVDAAWVQFPSLDVKRLAQAYARMDSNRYRYQSFKHDFTAMLEVDELGLIRSYESLWERLAEADLRPE